MRIHCIGIGGIGVSALAQYYLANGNRVSGSDLVASEITDFLKNKGVTVMIGNTTEHITKDIDLVIYSPAVQHNNPEFAKAKELGIKLQSYPEALGKLTKEYYTIAVAGAHGKSTTTAMIGLFLEKAGLDPTVVVGTKLKEFGGANFRMGKSKFLVIEACEYDSSFLNYFPKITVITNVDKEHLDYFGTFENVIGAFKDFILKLPRDGYLVASGDDKNMPKFAKPNFGTTYYSIKQKEAKKLKKILKIPGQHNILNALAALSVARLLGIDDKTSFESLSEYTGSWRRFETFYKKLIKPNKLKAISYTLISDYGHHPNEVLATLNAAREKYKNKKIWLIFQPHQYQRTYYLFDDFVKVFKKVKIDNIIIIDIYDVAGREEKKISSSVNSENLVKKINKPNVKYFPIKKAENYVKENIKNGEVLIIMGAGSIYKLADEF